MTGRSASAGRASLPKGYDRINRYSRVIVDEALARGAGVEILDASLGELRLTVGDRTLTTFESLSELTDAVAFRRCDDKLITRRVLADAGLSIPAGRLATFGPADVDFLHRHRLIVVKPARGEQGWGVTIGVTAEEDLEQARAAARNYCPRVLLEEQCDGDDIRAVVIGGDLVAAAVRRPATVTGDGASTVAQLIEAANQRRDQKNGTTGQLAIDASVARMVALAGWDLATVLPPGRTIVVSPTANVHNGATISDVTTGLHPALVTLAEAAANAIGLPVAGVDLMAPSFHEPVGVIIEVNEQPGLANHEPHPTAARFLDLLFPETAESSEASDSRPSDSRPSDSRPSEQILR